MYFLAHCLWLFLKTYEVNTTFLCQGFLCESPALPIVNPEVQRLPPAFTSYGIRHDPEVAKQEQDIPAPDHSHWIRDGRVPQAGPIRTWATFWALQRKASLSCVVAKLKKSKARLSRSQLHSNTNSVNAKATQRLQSPREIFLKPLLKDLNQALIAIPSAELSNSMIKNNNTFGGYLGCI